MQMPRSLRTRLIFVVLLTTLVALVVALGAMIAFDLHSSRRAWTSDLRTQAELLGQTIAPALTFDDPKSAREDLAVLRSRPQVRAAAVYTSAGALFATYAATPREQAVPPTAQPDQVRIDGSDVIVFERIDAGGEAVGTVYLRARHDLDSRLASYAGIALAVALFAMGVAFLLSFWLQRIVTRPILSISKIAREVVQQHDYSRRAEKLSEDEVGVLVESFNDMMAEIDRHSQENEASLQRIAHEVNERRMAQQEVMHLNQDLERRVQERTAQLVASNRELGLATESAEKANRAKSEFISSMSHELRTPLNAILGFGELLVTPGLAPPEPKRIEFTQHILKAGRHLLNLINEILDLAKIESSNMMLSLEPVALDDVFTECRTMLEPAASERGIRIVFPASPAPSAIADRTRLKQVLLNLLSNAIKYNRNGGIVTVEIETPAPERLRVAVRDTGRGLTPEQLAALFQPFNRLGQEAGPVEGTGIGLVVTKRLLELMGGSISVESTVGLGSAFAIELKAVDLSGHAPAVPQDAQVSAHVDAQPVELHGTLLHIEDNPANLKLVEEIVRFRADLGHMSAPDAQLGLELARLHLPQIILLDLNLPGLSGHDALGMLRSDPKTAHIPVIAVTANAMPRDIARGLAAGFFRYVTKPISVASLNEAIDSALAAAQRAE
jgi:signal transduction histidine kinase/CheY-like chemotaxis protein